jgi:hypothetical protein
MKIEYRTNGIWFIWDEREEKLKKNGKVKGQKEKRKKEELPGE